MSDRVSVIVPIYKVEEYIEKAIQSVLNQDYPDIELILVDDCTPDKSAEVAKECIASASVPYKLLHHDRNKGLSEARNTGIEAATGAWIIFLDSDDAFHDATAISRLVNIAQLHDADCVIGNTTSVYQGKSRISKRYSEFASYLDQEILVAYTEGAIPVPAQNKLIKTALVKENCLYFEPGMINEDELWSLKLCFSLNKVIVSGELTYDYLVREGSIMRAKAYNRWLSAAKAYGKTIDFAINEGHANLPVLRSMFQQTAWIRLKGIITDSSLSERQRYEIYKQIRDDQKRIKGVHSLKSFLLRTHLLLGPRLGYSFMCCAIQAFNTAKRMLK